MDNFHRRLRLFNSTAMWLATQQIIASLQGPTLLYHDGRRDLDTLAKMIASSRPTVIIECPARPSPSIIYKPQSIVFTVKDPESIVPNLRDWDMWNARGKILVIVSEKGSVFPWINTLWTRTRAANVLIVLQKNNTSEFYTWFPYRANNCRDVVNITQIYGPEFFPVKINPPLNDCPLLAVASPLPPIVVDDYDGLEVRFFRDFAHKLGLNASFVHLPKNIYVWTLYNASGSPVNGLKLLKEYEVDLMFSQLSLRPAMESSDYLVPHLSDEMVWFVPGPKLAPKASAIYRGFSFQIWIFIIITYITLFLVYLVTHTNKYSDISGNFLIIISIAMNLPSKFTFSRTLNVLAITAYVYSLHITSAYQSSLIIFLSDNPRDTPIRNLKDLSESKYQVEFHAGHRIYVEDLIKTKSEFLEMHNEKRLQYTGYLELRLVMEPPAIALLGPKIAFGFEMLSDRYYDEFGHPKVLMLPEPLFSSYMTFHVALGHPLHPFLNRYSQYLVEAGMPQFHIRNLSKYPRQRLRYLQAFTVETVSGSFQLFLVMILLSTATWVIEWCFFAWNLFCYQSISCYGFTEWGTSHRNIFGKMGKRKPRRNFFLKNKSQFFNKLNQRE